MTKIAIIGTAGRDKSIPMTAELWEWMLFDVCDKVTPDMHLVSGGAAWADHLAVWLFIHGHVRELTLHLPAPFDTVNHRFIGPDRSAAGAANYYHQRFRQVIGENTLKQISQAAGMEHCHGTFQAEAHGYSAMFTRNAKVAKDAEDGVIAYTFGEGDTPADGGTKNTWDQCRGNKVHVPLPRF